MMRSIGERDLRERDGGGICPSHAPAPSKSHSWAGRGAPSRSSPASETTNSLSGEVRYRREARSSSAHSGQSPSPDASRGWRTCTVEAFRVAESPERPMRESFRGRNGSGCRRDSAGEASDIPGAGAPRSHAGSPVAYGSENLVRGCAESHPARIEGERPIIGFQVDPDAERGGRLRPPR